MSDEINTALLDRASPEETAWRWFAEAHPHEAHETWPDRFWKFFQELRPGVDRETMERLLRETEEDKP